MALRDYYRCTKCNAKIVYGPDRPEDDWEPFLLCRSCLAALRTENGRLIEALRIICDDGTDYIVARDMARAALNPSAP